MIRVFFSLSFLLTFTSQLSAAPKKTIDEHWKEVDWKYSDLLQDVIKEDLCYSSERDLLSCLYGLNAMISRAEDGTALVPTERVQNEKGFGKVTKTFGPLSLVQEKILVSDSVAEIYDFNKKEKATVNKGWKKIYANKATVKIPFKDITDWLVQQKFFTDNESATAATGVNAILAVLRDPHTRYVPTAYWEDQSSPNSENFVGIGISIKVIKKGGKSVFLITAPIEGGPALAAGIRAGDIIKEIDGKKVDGLTIDELSTLIRGEKGKTIKLTILREGNDRSYSIVRAEIRIDNVSGSLVADAATSVGYVKFRSFMKPTGCKDIEDKIKNLETQGAKALIFDLRDNGGGLLSQAVCIANLFIEKQKTIVTIKSLVQGTPDRNLEGKSDPVTQLPLVTLINARSASASELVSGALQDYKRSFILGDRSYGKGTVQTQEKRDKVTFLKTIARFLLPSGRTNQIEGVLPDLSVFSLPTPTKDDLVAYREEDEYNALPTLGTPWKQTRPDAVKELTKCMGDSGEALKKYKKGQANPVAPDFQMLTAVDAAVCLANGKPTVAVEDPIVSYHQPKDRPSSAIERAIETHMREAL